MTVSTKFVTPWLFLTAAFFAVMMLTSSCAPYVDQILESNRETQAAVEAAQDEYREGNITYQELLDEIARLTKANGERIVEVKDRAAADLAAVTEATDRFFGGLTGTELLGTLGTLLGGSGLLYAKTRKDAVKVVNQERDEKRKERGEPT